MPLWNMWVCLNVFNGTKHKCSWASQLKLTINGSFLQLETSLYGFGSIFFCFIFTKGISGCMFYT
jgi:hypothetical protein